MSHRLKRLSAFFGLLVLSSVAAFAQTTMTFEVPFDFTTPTATLTAGRYEISSVNVLSNTAVYRLKNLDSGRVVGVAAPIRVLRTNAEGEAEISFQCAGERCALAAIYSPFRDAGAGIPVRLKPEGPNKELAMIRIPASE